MRETPEAARFKVSPVTSEPSSYLSVLRVCFPAPVDILGFPESFVFQKRLFI